MIKQALEVLVMVKNATLSMQSTTGNIATDGDANNAEQLDHLSKKNLTAMIRPYTTLGPLIAREKFVEFLVVHLE